MTRRITEAERRKAAWEMVEDISTHATSLDPKRDWETSHDAVCEIYKIAHSIRGVKCRKHHPKWSEKIDAAVLAERRRRAKK